MDLYSCKLEIAVCSVMENPGEYLECIRWVNCMKNPQLFYQPRYKEMTISVQKSVEGGPEERGGKRGISEDNGESKWQQKIRM